MGVLIDTSLLVAFERGQAQPEVVNEESAISVITVSELLHGFHRATGVHRNRRLAGIEAFLELYEILDITEAVARVHSAIWAQLRGEGVTVAPHDLWIGATALTHGLGVITRNARDFTRIPGLRVLTA